MLGLWRLVLLLGLLLQLGFSLPSAAEDHEEQQKEDKAREHMLRDERGPPVNVVVTTVSDTTLNVSWEEPTEEAEFYTVEVATESINEISNTTYFLLEELKPCTSYLVIVDSLYDMGTVQYQSLPVTGTTASAVPPAPDCCIISDTTNTTMRVMWTAPETPCRVIEYRLRWTWDSLSSDEKGSNETEVGFTRCILDHLPPYSNITVEVAGYTEAGLGGSTFCWDVTAPGARAPPRNVTVDTVSDSSLRVSWVPPDETPQYYQVGLDLDTYNASATVSSLLVEGLQSCKNYVAIVHSVYEDILNFASTPSSNTTDISVPPEPAGCWALGKEDFSDVDITWSEPLTDCVIVNYSISWTWEDLWQGGLSGSDQDFTTDKAITLTDLPPYSNFTVEVAAATEAGFGDATTCWGKTAQDVPGPPFLESLEVQHDSIIVSWTEPEEKNGIVDNYMINWQDTEGGSFNITTGEAVDLFQIPNLQPCMTYTVFVQAHTGGGWGGDSDTDDAVIKNYMIEPSFNCDSQGARKVELTWRMAFQDCPVSGYSLVWETDVLWLHQNSSNSTTISGSKTSVTFTDLEPFTLFAAHLTPVGAQDEAEQYCRITTFQEEPSEPTNLKIISTTTTTAMISWSLPEQLNGVLDQWHLTWSRWNDSGNETYLEAPELQYTIEDLVPGTTYLVTITAHNEGGYGEPEMIDVTTNSKNTQQLGLIIGLSVGGSLLLILVLAALGFYKCKRPSSQASEDEADSQSEVDAENEGHDTYSSDQYDPQQRNYLPQRYGKEKQAGREYPLGSIGKYLQRRQSSMYIGDVAKPKVNNEQRRASNISEVIPNGDNDHQRRASQAQDRENAGVEEDFRGHRRASAVPGGDDARVQDYSGQRRASEMYPTGMAVVRDFPGQRRASEMHPKSMAVVRDFPGQRRASEMYPRGMAGVRDFPGQRRASEMYPRGMAGVRDFPGQRRASEMHPRGMAGVRDFPGQRRASEMHPRSMAGVRDFPGQRRASEMYPRGMAGVRDFPGQKSAPEMYHRDITGVRDYHGRRRASEMQYRPSSGVRDYHGQRRASEMYDRAISGVRDYHGQKRASEMLEEERRASVMHETSYL